jgi:Tfp pilus assembly protein PilF
MFVSFICDQGARGQTLPADLGRSGESEVRFNQGLLHYQQGLLTSAEEDFRAVLNRSGDDVEARYYLGLTLLSRGRADEALAELDRVLSADPQYTPARAARAASLIRLKRYSDAEPELTALERDPEYRASALSLRGQMLYDQGRYQDAAAMFQRAREAGASDAPEAALLEGLSLYRAGQWARSRAALRQSARIDLDPSLSLAMRQLEAQLQEQRGAKRWEFELSAGYEYDSNVGLFQSGVTLPSDVSQRGDGRFVLEPRGRLFLLRNQTFEAGVGTTNYFSFQSKLSEFDLDSYQVGAFANWRIAPNVVLGLRYDFNDVDLGYEPYLKRNFVTPEITVFENNFGYTGAFYQFDARQYQSVAGEGALNRDGQVAGVGIVQSINLPEFFRGAGRAELQLLGRFRNQQTKGQDYDGDFYDLGATLFLPLPGKLKADVGINFDIQDYKNPNTLDAENRRRHDCEFDFEMGITRQLNEWAAIRAAYAYSTDDSNVRTAAVADQPAENPYEFSHHVVGVMMIFTF